MPGGALQHERTRSPSHHTSYCTTAAASTAAEVVEQLFPQSALPAHTTSAPSGLAAAPKWTVAPSFPAVHSSTRSNTAAASCSQATVAPASHSSNAVAAAGERLLHDLALAGHGSTALATFSDRLRQDLAALEERQLALYPHTSYTRPLGRTGAARQQLGHASKNRRKLHHLQNKRQLVRRAPLGVAQEVGGQKGMPQETVMITKYRTLQTPTSEKRLARAQVCGATESYPSCEKQLARAQVCGAAESYPLYGKSAHCCHRIDATKYWKGVTLCKWLTEGREWSVRAAV